ncbi:hypothetical protein AB6A40_003905 [Gnathostoma spinigerum]|uniref:Jumonji domain-containing protein 4 n=1 Tax=Gnathostoma spinigerum TaxID=75299 RepID=A0ABD6EC19_9BILA
MSGDQKCPFPIVRIENHTALELFLDYMLGNKPVILHANTTANWLSRRKWVISQDSNVADLRYFRERFGEMVVPEIDGKQCDYETMRLRDFIDYLEDENSRKKSDYKYVKDWHFQKESGTEYAAYQLPSFLKFDWINNEEWSATEANPLGDYRFVYFGIKGSWTVYHSDVMSSYSWSANICGRKLWYFTPPGKEELFRKDRCSFLKDIRERQGVWKEACVSSFIQQPGEIVFVPSNWYHQVHNLEDAISINHNFINASNVDLVYGLICQRLTDVIEEISDARADFTPQEFSDQCQLILKADIRINFDILRQLVELVFEDRIKSATSCWVCPKHLSCIFECKKDSECIERTRQVLLSNCRCYNSEICHSCTSFMCSYELSCACECLEMIFRVTNVVQ